VSISLADPNRVGTFLTPGSHIVLFDTFDAAAGSSGGDNTTSTSTRVLLDDILVIAMGQASLTPAEPADGKDDGAAPVAGALVTVAVTPADAVRLVHGIQTGRLYAALRGNDAKIDLGKVVSQATLFTGK
jgi:pilus assembly protein CpaB